MHDHGVPGGAHLFVPCMMHLGLHGKRLCQQGEVSTMHLAAYNR